jgi:outer membrane immunogenic protein
MSKSLKLVSLLGAFMLTGSSLSLGADILMPSAPTWDGIYLGVTAGVSSSHVEALPVFDPTTISLSGNTQSGSSLTFGAQLGYDHQFGPLVLGVLGEVNHMNVSTSGGFNEDDASNQPWGTEVGQWLGSARLRAGFGTDSVLFYGSGGLAFGNAKISNWNYESSGNENYSFSSTGYVFGGGVEVRVSEHLSFTGDYSHYVFKSSNNTQVFSDDGPSPGGNNKLGIDLFKVGLNYRF